MYNSGSDPDIGKISEPSISSETDVISQLLCSLIERKISNKTSSRESFFLLNASLMMLPYSSPIQAQKEK